ncbi:MAG: hypothetical protein AAGF20_12470 [Pseudomonadota bacterium]
MVEKLILFSALGVPALAWLLALQMRALTVQALFLAAQDRFKGMDAPDVRLAAKASPGAPLSEVYGPAIVEAGDWLAETYPKAVGHLRLARRASLAAPLVLLAVAAVWRFGFGEIF